MPTEPIARLLVVDDEAAQAKALRDTLGDEGYEVTACGAPVEALELLKQRKFDLLLTDLRMPQMDGIQLLQKALELDRELIGIMMTGHGTIDSAVQAMKAGALDYILKPFNLSEVLPVLSRALAVRQLRREKAELESRVRQRTLELESANHELEAFAFSVSHDLRAPLRHIRNFAAMLLQEASCQDSESAKELLGHISQSAGRMNQLIDDLLRLSRLGRQPLVLGEVDVAQLARQVADELLPEHRERALELEIGELPKAMADPNLLRSVFENLISNALKFTRGRQPASIEIGARQQGGETVYFVKDNGAGFDMRYASKLFGVFQRMHAAEDFEGTGVGLSIVQRIVRRHGGRIWAEAEVGKGAAFYFTLSAPNGHA